jgi:hypothetical protein
LILLGTLGQAEESTQDEVEQSEQHRLNPFHLRRVMLREASSRCRSRVFVPFTHRGSAEVLCAAFCTGEGPLVWWEEQLDTASAREREHAFKSHYGEPPQPRPSYEGCVNGAALLARIIGAAGPDSWEAGFAEAVFRIGEKLSLLFQPRFESIWQRVGIPPGPWAALTQAEEAP